MATPSVPPCRATTAWRAPSPPTADRPRDPLASASARAPHWRRPSCRWWELARQRESTRRPSRTRRHRGSGRWCRAAFPRAQSSVLPCDRPLFRGVDLFLAPLLEQKGLHVLGEEASCLRVHHVESVMVDEHGLLLEPLSPTVLTDLSEDAGTDGAGEGRTLESGARLSAADAGDCGGHAGLLGAMVSAAESKHLGESVNREP